MSDTTSSLRVNPTAEPGQAIIIRPRTLPTTAQFEIETQLAWKLRNARGFLPNHFMVGDDHERSAKILAAIEYARAVGIEPMIALQNTQVIDGKVGASALLIGALLRKAGYTITDDTNDVRSIVTVSKNGTAVKGEFSMQDAQRAQLVKPNSGWQKYPRDMMYARALTQAARRGAQDAVLGMAYTAEEFGGIEEEIAGVPALGEVIDQAPGVSEAQVSPPAAAIQPTPPAPSVGVVSEQAATAAATVEPGAVQVPAQGDVPAAPASTSPPPQTPAPANAAPVAPLAGVNVSRRLGAGRSISPVRRNVTTVQPPETPATAPLPPEMVPANLQPVPAQPAPSALTDEPVLPPAPVEPEDPGKAVYLNDLRGNLRVQTAELFRVNALLDNVKRGLEGKEPTEVPPRTPTEASDRALAQRIDSDWPGRKLENLGEAELTTLIERFDANLSKKREVLKERGISEE